MGKLGDVGRTLVWYGKHPYLLPELGRQAIIAVRGKKPYFRAEAESYCREHALDLPQALHLVGLPFDVDSIRAELEKPLQAAQSRISAFSDLMGGGASTELLFALVRGSKARYMVETGVAFGWSSLAILVATNNDPDSRLVSVDMPYVKGNTDHLVGLCVPDSLRDRWTLIRRADREGIPQALKILPELDLAHYDSDKTVEGREFAYPRLWAALKPGGFLVSDDVSDNTAFIDFCKSLNAEPVIVRCDDKFAGIVQKPQM